ncbi:MAG: deoxyribose-phosphate aldolase [Micrococcaceae bacterium]
MTLNSYIDHTLLKPNATQEQIVKLCEEAKEYNFASVCVNPVWVSLAAQELEGSAVKVCTVIGFPLGATSTAAKVAETQQAIADGADEVDMVINMAAANAGDKKALVADISAVVQAAHSENAIVKVIIETSQLDENAKVLASEAAKDAGADFVKTSTGFNGGGATVDDIKLMRQTVGPDMGVKASGGVRNAQDAQALVDAGATRLGASAGIDIVSGGESSSDY